MINAQMKPYSYYSYGSQDDYGQESLSGSPEGAVNMAIKIMYYTAERSISD